MCEQEFSKIIAPILKANLKFLKGYDAVDLFLYFNSVRPSLIRVDADELTHNFHIAIRYEIEKKLLAGEIGVSELPSIWAEYFDDYLGIITKDDSQGVLQDTHWSRGGFASFPSSTIGNIIDGMLWNASRKKEEGGLDLSGAIKANKILKIEKWLGQNIHHYGSTFAPQRVNPKAIRRTGTTLTI